MNLYTIDDDAAVMAEIARLHEAIDRKTAPDRLEQATPPKVAPLFQPARYKGLHGGRGGAKSQTFARMLLARANREQGLRAVCVREFQKSLEQSVKRLLDDLITKYRLESRGFRSYDTRIDTPGDGIIIFQGMQNHTAESIKSLEGYKVAWVEEAQTLSAHSLDLLRPTIREEDSELWFSWNPRHPTDPVDVLLRGTPAPPDATVLEISWDDNPWFPEVLRKEMEWDRGRDIEKWRHVWGGGYERHSEARVFKNWTIAEFDPPYNAAFLYGGDWGFSIDPTVAVRNYVDGRNLYIDREVYRVGCEIDDTTALFDSLGCTKDHVHDCDLDRDHRDWSNPQCDASMRKWELTTDSARPETISYMQRHGYPRCVGARKGQNSVEEGVQFLKNYNIIVHPRCKHVIDELTNYSYKTNPLTDQIIPVLEDKKNHVIDSLRYSVEKLRKAQGLTW